MIIAADIGGTNTRIALFENRGKRDPVHEEKYKSHDFSDFSSLLKTFLKTISLKNVQKMCLGVAGPVQNGRCQTTNLPWVIDANYLSREMNIPFVWIINDLEANAWGLRALRPEELFVLNQGVEHKANAALIAAGTGLGEAGLYWDGKIHQPFACEGGHCGFAPSNEEEVALWSYLKERFEHVSYERILSGAGIFNLYQFLVDTKREKADPSLEGVEQPQKVITEKALKKESKVCMRTMELFSSIYGSEAGNLALKMFATHGVYIGGGIAPKIVDILKEGGFIHSFVAKGRFLPLLSHIPVKVVLNDQTALLGAAEYGRRYQ